MSAPFADYLAAVEETCVEHPDWRYGQAAFNVLYAFDSRLANLIRGSNLDPFYRAEADINPAFWDHVAEGLS